MGYHTWSTYGYGICVDGIKTTPDRLLKLARLDFEVLADIREYLHEYFDGKDYSDEDLTIEDFDELEGEYGERGVAYVLYQLIKETNVTYVDDYNGTPYILYVPTFPWYMKENERLLTEEEVNSVFKKYVSILTDDPVVIDYYEVENGG